MLQNFFFELFKSAKNHSAPLTIIFLAIVAMLVALADMNTLFLEYIMERTLYIFISTSGLFISTYCFFRVIYLTLRMIIIIKPKSPIRHLLYCILDAIKDIPWLANFLLTMIMFSIFAIVFSINKAMIGAKIGFNWDAFFSELDKVILFGKYPHEFFLGVLNSRFIIGLYEISYVSWFYVNYFCITAVAARLFCNHISQKFLLSSIICWFLGGNVVAAFFNSAGPIFFELHGISSYSRYFDTIRDSAPVGFSITQSVKDKLLQSYNLYKFSSISAFPSMHVASTVLICFFARGVSRLAFKFSLGFLFFIFTGSFVLLWHYLVDSISGVLIAVLSWLAAGKILDLQKGNSEKKE